MRTLLSNFRGWMLMLLLLCAAGCGQPPMFQVTTIVGAGGRTERTIVQPRKGFLPATARPEGVGTDGEELAPQWIAQWQSVAPAAEPPAKTKPDAKFDKDHPYFIARGSFASPDKIPSHYRFQQPDAEHAIASELKREYSRTDFGLLVEYRWEEAITNRVSLADFLAARDKLLDGMLPPFVDEINQTLAGKYHTKPLEGFLLGEGRQVLAEMALAWYETAATRSPAGELSKRLAAIFEAHGLPLTAPDAGADADKMLENLVVQILANYLQHPDGKQVTADEAKAIMDAASNIDEDDTETAERRKRLEEKLSAAMRDAPIEQFTGAYPWVEFFFKPVQFDFSLELPGVLIETNGLIQAANRCRWRFTAVDTFPSGYRMTARSVAIEPETQRKLLKRVIVADAGAAAEFIELVGRDGPLFNAVNQAFASGKLDAIQALQGTDEESRKRVERLQAMFEEE